MRLSFFKHHLRSSIFVLSALSILTLYLVWETQRAAASSQEQGDRWGAVTAVYDGDTIRVKLDNGESEIVRLIGVDAPELGDNRTEVRFLAFMSKRFAFYHLYRERVRLVFDWERRDKYDRLLAFVFADNRLFNEFILLEGFASVFLKYPYREDFREKLEAAHQEARDQGRGFWQVKPYPKIAAHEAKQYIGKLLTVRFYCKKVQVQGKFLFLHAETGEFSVVIEKDRLEEFRNLESFRGKRVEATGFLEDYKGKPQVFVFLPSQIRSFD